MLIDRKRGSGDSMGEKIKKGRQKGIVIGILSGIVLVAVFVVGLLCYNAYYKNRWYRHTVINGVDVSGQTLEVSAENLIQDNKDYRLSIKARQGGSFDIDGGDIAYSFAISESFRALFNQQHESAAALFRGKEYAVEYDVSYQEDKLRDILEKSELLVGSDEYPIQKPKSAFVEFSQELQHYEVVEEDPGNTLIKENFYAVVEEALKQAKAQINLEDAQAYPDVYKAPKLLAGDESMQEMLNACNNAALRFITWNMGEGVKEQITPNEISQWISYKNGSVKYDNAAIAEWVEAFCLKYKTVGKTRKIKAHNGKKVKISGGDYGWQMDYNKTLKQAKQALKQEIDRSLTESYIKDPSDENKKALNIKEKVVYLNTAFQKDYENFAVDWDTENYTEISISKQMVYVFRKGKVAFKCRCITGRPVEGRRTPKGAYFIKEHREAYTLTGADYKTPVINWVRITWTGTGFHPATWQPWSRWTKDLYKTKGSHGCINLAPADAEKIYKMTSYREAVFIY